MQPESNLVAFPQSGKPTPGRYVLYLRKEATLNYITTADIRYAPSEDKGKIDLHVDACPCEDGIDGYAIQFALRLTKREACEIIKGLSEMMLRIED